LNKEKATWKKSFEKSKKEYQEEAVAKVWNDIHHLIYHGLVHSFSKERASREHDKNTWGGLFNGLGKKSNSKQSTVNGSNVKIDFNSLGLGDASWIVRVECGWWWYFLF
jgi:hypothetical protein